jgi:hypothetical protein
MIGLFLLEKVNKSQIMRKAYSIFVIFIFPVVALILIFALSVDADPDSCCAVVMAALVAVLSYQPFAASPA